MVQRNKMPLPQELFLGMAPHELKIRASVVFGQTSLGCKGNGICRVDMLTAQKQIPKVSREENTQLGNFCERYPMEIVISEYRAVLFRFNRQKLGNILPAPISTNQFIVAEEFLIPAWLKDKVSLNWERIEKGSYPIIHRYLESNILFGSI